jgi:hypothetical protein
MSKSRIATLMLLAVIVIYTVSLSLAWWRYNQMPVETYDERLGHYFVTRKSFLDTCGALPYFYTGAVLVALTLMWMVLTQIHMPSQKKRRNKE